MIELNSRKVRIALAAAALALAGCGGGGGGGGGGTQSFDVQLSLPDNANVVVGTVLNLTAVAVGTDGSRLDVTPTWSVSGGITQRGDGRFVAGTVGAGDVIATYHGVTHVATFNVVQPGTLSSFQILQPANRTVTTVPLAAKVNFYLTAADAGNGGARTYLQADAGGWGASPTQFGSLDDYGLFTPSSDGTHQVTAKSGGSQVASLNVTVVAPTFTVSGTALDHMTPAKGVSGVVVVFWNGLSDEVGRMTTGTDGTFSGSVSSKAATFWLASVPEPAYHREYLYTNLVNHTALNYILSGGSGTCKAPVPTLTGNLNVGTLYIYPAGELPPQPGCKP